MAGCRSFKPFLYLQICNILSQYAFAFPDQGQSSEEHTNVLNAYFGMHKSLYAGSSISVSMSCEPYNVSNKIEVEISWILRQSFCFAEYLGSEIYAKETLKMYYNCPMDSNGFSTVRYFRSTPNVTECSPTMRLEFQNVVFSSTMENYKLPKGCPSVLVPGTVDPSSSTKNKADAEYSKGIGTLKISDIDSVKRSNIRKREDLLADKKNNLDAIKNGTSASKTKDGPLQSLEKNSSIILLSTTKPVDVYNTKNGFKLGVADIDGIYLFILKIESVTGDPINITAAVTMKGDYGYLSAADFPLLIFYGFMCAIYVLYAFAWLVVSARQWRDLLRIQFWIGGVILLGLIEKAVFYAEYQSINTTGQSVQGAVLFAEILSCMKRTLARMLVIIVSLGFGIVKPRLGSSLRHVVGVGMVYFILGVIEGCLRVLKPKSDPNNQALIAGVPLAVTDSIICWWIFSSLVQTMRTLRLRRNLVKLQLYRHFTNTLIFSVIASVVYMVWSIHSHKLVTCISDWKELWVDEAFWHLLFSLILLVIMILLWPTNNNQRYAYTPLLDAVDDENDDDFDQNPANDAFGMKMRSLKTSSGISPNQNDIAGKEEDDLKWVEENIPSSLTEAALPNFLDSDEEIMTVKFERSKME